MSAARAASGHIGSTTGCVVIGARLGVGSVTTPNDFELAEDGLHEWEAGTDDAEARLSTTPDTQGAKRPRHVGGGDLVDHLDEPDERDYTYTASRVSILSVVMMGLHQ